MKTIQIIDSAVNCTFSLFEATDEEFAWLFPEPGQDIQFSEDIVLPAGRSLAGLWQRPMLKTKANGIHGTLFYNFADRRRHFPSSKRERDWDASSINPAQRALYSGDKERETE
jgi:hypothetical protein